MITFNGFCQFQIVEYVFHALSVRVNDIIVNITSPNIYFSHITSRLETIQTFKQAMAPVQ